MLPTRSPGSGGTKSSNDAAEPFEARDAGGPDVRGFLHRPAAPPGDGLVLTHGAGGHANTPLLVELAAAFADAGVTTLRCDLPFRQWRRTGPPLPRGAGRDRAGLRHAIVAMRAVCPGRLFLGGQSYGGRMASILAADEPSLVSALLLLSYPLHPPGKPHDLRTDHLPRLTIPALFVHGDADPFASADELSRARGLIPARSEVVEVKGGHDLGYSRAVSRQRDLPAVVVRAFAALTR